MLLPSHAAISQNVEPQDTIPTHRLDSIGSESGDAIRIESYAARFNPQKALLYSAILPGAGQIYNRAAWKVPIIYGGFITMGYGIKWYNDHYVLYKDMLFSLLNEVATPETDSLGNTALGNRYLGTQLLAPYPYNLGIDALRSRVNRWRRDRDFAVMLTALWYVLQMVEAHVDAHLKEFKVNPQLKVSVEPSFQNSYATGRTSGLQLTLRF